MSELMLDVGQANEIKMALRREGSWTNEEIKILCERKGFLTQVHEALLGRAEFKQVKYLVDLDAKPYIPDGWKVEEHQKGGQFKYDATKVELYLADEQKKGSIQGNKLRQKLESKNPFNANLLDFLLAHPELIPDSWKGKFIFFWGTIYRCADGNLYVRYLHWSGDGWFWHFYWLEDDWYSAYPAAVLGK